MSFFKKDDPEVDGRWIERMRHSPPEQVEVIEFVIKVVENLADLEARVERINCFISLVERLGESSEHMGEGDVGFPVSVITRRIVDKGGALLVARCIAAPQVSMKKGGAWGVIGEEGGRFSKSRELPAKLCPLFRAKSNW